MSGWVHKFQSRMPSCVRRYFRLSDSTLANHANLSARPTWKLSVSRATVRADYTRNLVIVTCSTRHHLRFQVQTTSEAHRWLVALRSAAVCNIDDFYTQGDTIGMGSFGTVRRAVDKLTGMERAVKIVHRSTNQKEREFVHREVSVLLTITHPHVVRTYDIFDERHRMLVVMAFVPCGDLFEYIAQQKSVAEGEVKLMMWQILRGVAYLHEHHIVHRDIKLENVLLASRQPLHLQLTDFGFANFVKPTEEGKVPDLNSLVGTGSYMAPELVDGRGHGKPVDLFAAGVAMYRIVAGKMPFRAMGMREKYEMAVNERADLTTHAWMAMSKEARTVCKGMLMANPKARMTAAQVLAHEWFVEDREFMKEAQGVDTVVWAKQEKETQREQDMSDRQYERMVVEYARGGLAKLAGSGRGRGGVAVLGAGAVGGGADGGKASMWDDDGEVHVAGAWTEGSGSGSGDES